MMNEDFLSYVLVTNDVGSQIRYISVVQTLVFPLVGFGRIFISCDKLMLMFIKFWKFFGNKLD